MKIRIDYLNSKKEVRHYFNILDDRDDCERLGMDIRDFLVDWATDMYIYKL